MKNFDVIIVGAGTAGLMLARELSKSKKQVLVLDRKKTAFRIFIQYPC